MAVQQKNRAAFELKQQAEQIRSELLDPSKTFTTEEVQQKSAAISSLEQRAALAGGFTADEEIADQGGDETLRRQAPDSREPEVLSHRENVAKTAKAIDRTFGGLNTFIRKTIKGEELTAAEQRVVNDVKLLTRTIVGTTSDSSGGEFLLPLQQVASIFSVDNTVPGILEGARRFPMAGRTIRIPFVKQATASNTRPLSGIAAVAIIGEGVTAQNREVAFDQRLMTAYKIAAYSQIGDETLADDLTGEAEQTLGKLVGTEIMNQFNAWCTIDGSGSSQPTGALHTNNAALIKQTRQTANTITPTDVFNLYAKHTHGPKSFWLVSRRAVIKLWQLELSSGSMVTQMPNLAGKPQMQLLGLPIVVSDFLASLGSEGDLALVNPDFYAVAIRQALTVARSEHVAFLDGEMTYRFTARAGGIPIPDGTYAYKSPSGTKVDEHSPFVVLDDVVTS